MRPQLPDQLKEKETLCWMRGRRWKEKHGGWGEQGGVGAEFLKE